MLIEKSKVASLADLANEITVKYQEIAELEKRFREIIGPGESAQSEAPVDFKDLVKSRAADRKVRRQAKVAAKKTKRRKGWGELTEARKAAMAKNLAKGRKALAKMRRRGEI